MLEITPANLMQIVFSIQALFFSIIAFRQNLKVFSALLITFATHMLFNYFIESNTFSFLPDITSAFGIAYGPLFYLYLKEITQSNFKFAASLLKLAIVFIVSIPFSPAGLVFNIVASIWTLYFIVKIVLYLKKYNRAIENSISDVISARLSWLNTIFLSLILVFIYDICRTLLFQYTDIVNSPIYYLITLISAFLTISAFALFSLQFKQRFDGIFDSELSNLKEKPEDTCHITPKQKQLVDRALEILKKDQLYLDPKLRLSDFSLAVGIESRELSRLLFAVSKQRFSKHTMTLRIEHAKKLIDESLSNSLPINLLNLSYHSGFNAKSSFNLAFKQTTGMTPSDYINR